MSYLKKLCTIPSQDHKLEIWLHANGNVEIVVEGLENVYMMSYEDFRDWAREVLG